MTVVDSRGHSRFYYHTEPKTKTSGALELDLDETDSRVYVALDPPSAQVKIGISDDVPSRIAQLRQRRPELVLLGTMRGGYNLERALHGRFRQYRAEGREWYRSEILGELEPIVRADRTFPNVFL